jgi:hypothetical protein
MFEFVGNFFKWYDRHLTESLALSAFILYLQIPHTISAAECFFDGNLGLFGIHPITDFLLYGIDLLELIPIIGVTLAIIARVKENRLSK